MNRFRLTEGEIEARQEKLKALMVADLLRGVEMTTYLESGAVNYVYTRDDLLNECEIFQKGDAAELLDNPEAFGARLYRRFKEAAEKWVDDHEEQLQAPMDQEDAA